MKSEAQLVVECIDYYLDTVPMTEADRRNLKRIARELTDSEGAIATLSTGPGARESDPDTSKSAAYDNAPRAGSQRAKCLTYILSTHMHGGTAEEVAWTLRLPLNSVSKRLGELEKGGWLITNDLCRKTSSGSDAHVYTASGKALLAR